MAKKEAMMKGETCGPHWTSWLILLAGVLYLLQDLGMGFRFWNLQWYTVAFIVWGLCGISMKGKW